MYPVSSQRGRGNPSEKSQLQIGKTKPKHPHMSGADTASPALPGLLRVMEVSALAASPVTPQQHREPELPSPTAR